MIPLHLAVPGLLACAVLGWGADTALGRASSGWIPKIVIGVALIASAYLHAAASIGLVVALAIAGRAAIARTPVSRRERGAALAIIAGGALVVWARPAVPLAWDEHVWLAKARLGALALRQAALDPSADVIPRGYPILASAAESVFALNRGDLAALVAGACAVSILSWATAIAMLPAERRLHVALALALVPLVVVHSRTAYLDLPVGLLSLAVLAAIARAREGDRGALHVAIATAFILAGTKDEGVIHVLAIALADTLSSKDGLARPALVSGAALLAFTVWRALLARAGIASTDHALDLSGASDVASIFGALATTLTDLRSWGVAWPLAIAATALALRDPRSRLPALALASIAIALVLGIVLGSERLRAFALAGTLLPRVLIQLAPIAAWIVVDQLARRRSARATASPTR